MKNIILVSKVLVYFFLILDAFFAVIAHGSGHNIPLETDLYILASGLILIFILLLLSYIERRLNM